MSYYKKIYDYKGFSVGDRFVVKSIPNLWDSTLKDNSPLSVKYPYSGVIKEILIYNNEDVAMTDGEYGWSLDNLIKFDKIITIKEQRRKKLRLLRVYESDL